MLKFYNLVKASDDSFMIDIGNIRIYKGNFHIESAPTSTGHVKLPFEYKNTNYAIIPSHSYARSNSAVYYVAVDRNFPITEDSFNLTSVSTGTIYGVSSEYLCIGEI